ncbi:MAG: PIG-L deacetylase family protein [Nitrososphaerota archaeon]
MTSSEVEYVRSLIGLRPERAFEECGTLLSIQPHPDDTEIAAGGTVAKLVKRGCRVIYVTVTDGGAGTTSPSIKWEELSSMRKKEQQAAAQTLGVTELVWLDYRDSELRPTLELRNKLITLIRQYRPDLILTVDPWLLYEAHPDHIATGLAASEAYFFSNLPNVNREDLDRGLKPHLTKHIAYYWTKNPNIYIDITDVIDLKMKAIEAHKSQFGPEDINLYRKISQKIGEKRGFGYGEAFKVLNHYALHVNFYADLL